MDLPGEGVLSSLRLGIPDSGHRQIVDPLNQVIMPAASERTGRFLTVHQNRRWDEDFLTVKKVMEEGKLGDIFRLEASTS